MIQNTALAPDGLTACRYCRLSFFNLFRVLACVAAHRPPVKASVMPNKNTQEKGGYFN